MIAHPQLHRIRTGEANPKEAKAAIRELIATADPTTYAALYGALRAWTWKAMQTRRFDDEMSEWFSILKGASAAVSKRDATVSHYLGALSHLVDESLRYAASHKNEHLLTRSHIGEILQLVDRNNGRIARERLKAEMRLGDSRLSQLLTELTINGLLEREQDSRQARFVLTDAGRELLDRWRATRQAPPPPYDDAYRQVAANSNFFSDKRALEDTSPFPATPADWAPLYSPQKTLETVREMMRNLYIEREVDPVAEDPTPFLFSANAEIPGEMADAG